MTKVINGSVFYATSIIFTKYSYFLSLLSLFSLQFCYPTNQPKNLGYTHTLFDATSTPLLPVIRTVHDKIS